MLKMNPELTLSIGSSVRPSAYMCVGLDSITSDGGDFVNWDLSDFHCYALKDIPRGHSLRKSQVDAIFRDSLAETYCWRMYIARPADPRFRGNNLAPTGIDPDTRLSLEDIFSKLPNTKLTIWFRLPEEDLTVEDFREKVLPVIYGLISHRKGPFQDVKDHRGTSWLSDDEHTSQLYNPIRYVTDDEEEMRRERERVGYNGGD